MIRPRVAPAFQVGDRVHLADRELCGTVPEVFAWPRVTAYRVAWDLRSANLFPNELWLERQLRFEV
jgi:hypothetical protein